MAEAPRPLQQPILLLGEGREEELFFTELLKALGRTDVAVRQYRGKDRLRTDLAALTQQAGFGGVRTLAITRDADDSEEAAFRSVVGALRNIKLDAPMDPGKFTGGKPRVGVFILPGGGLEGALEDLCLRALADDPTLACADAYLECLAQQDIRHAGNARSKARLHVWLASRSRPDLRLGEAATAGEIPWAHSAFDDLKAFLQQL